MRNFQSIFSCALITSLTLSSCSTYQTQLATREPSSGALCTDHVKAFFKNDNTTISAARFKQKLKLEITSDELASYLDHFPDLDLKKLSDEQIDTMRAIYLFSISDRKQLPGLVVEFKKTISGQTADLKNKDWDRFIKHKNKVEEYSQKKLMPKTQSLIYEKLYYSCRAQIQKAPSSSELKQAKYLTYALTAGAATSTATTYTAINWEQEKDAKWMKSLYFEVALSAMFTYVGGKFVTTNPKLKPWTGRAPVAYVSAAITDAGTSGVYAYFFNSSDKDAAKKFEALKNDPKVQEELAELLFYAQENKLFEKHAKESEDLFINKFSDKKMTQEEIKNAINNDKFDFETSRELLMEAIAERQYEENSGVLQTGHTATDRYAFHRLWGLASVPASVGLALIMKKQMCMSTNPKAAFGKAISIYFVGSVLLDTIYYKSRREVINQ